MRKDQKVVGVIKYASAALWQIFVVASLLAIPDLATAQDSYPNRVTKIIVPVVPGIAAADVLPRLVADKLTGRFRQPFIVENKPGANSNIGAELVADAAPNGYTLLATPPPPLVTNQYFYSKLNFDPGGFVPVTIIASLPNVLVVNPKDPFGSLDQLIGYAKANPDKLTYGSPGVGSSPYLAMEWFKHLAGIQITHVPYNGISPIVKDVMAGTIDMTFANTFTVLPQIKAGQMRALGVDSKKRFSDLPEVPTIAETFPGFVVTSWFAIVAPPKTPSQIVDKLSSAIAEVLKEPDVVAKLRDLSAAGVGNSPSEAAQFITAERERYHRAVEASGLKPIE
jgi:tripartite-type tricarboxylate transporter receptor subunit TctC